MLADADVGFWEKLSEQRIEVGVKLLKLLAGVAPVVLAVGVWHFGIHVEPVLNGFSPVFLNGGGAVGAFDDSAFHGLVVEFLQAFVEIRIHLDDADAVDGM